MPRRNRVDPFADLHAVAERGTFTGNRGCLVDEHGEVVRHHVSALWITCVTQFEDRRHPLGARHVWTPLFFLDDAVALAAGPRPCGECRRADYLAYRDAVTAAAGADAPLRSYELDRMLAPERLRRGRGVDRAGYRIVSSAPVDELPGTVVLDGGERRPRLVTARGLRAVGFTGWGPITSACAAVVEVLTPATSVAALRHGFVPRLHDSASTDLTELRTRAFT